MAFVSEGCGPVFLCGDMVSCCLIFVEIVKVFNHSTA